MINNLRTKQRGCVITLLDLKNAFGEVNRNLLVKIEKGDSKFQITREQNNQFSCHLLMK